MNIDEYSSELERLATVNAQNLVNLGQWVDRVALPWLWDELGGAILEPKKMHPLARTAPKRQRLTPMKDSMAVRQGLMTSVADRVTMATVVPYFQAQMTMLDSEAKIYCSTVASFGKVANPFAADAAIHTLHRAMHELMSYARTLLEDAGREIAGLPGFFGAWRSQRDHPFEVFKGTEQIIYGSYSGMTHTDRAPYIPVAVLRTAIELRLRHAFGIYSLVDPAKPQDTSPIDMGRLFEAMQKKQSEIEFAVDMHDVGESTDGATFIFTEGSGTSHGSQVFCFDISVPSSSARPIA